MIDTNVLSNEFELFFCNLLSIEAIIVNIGNYIVLEDKESKKKHIIYN